MPTLFTALRAHAQRQKAEPQKARPTFPAGIPAGGQPDYTAEGATHQKKIKKEPKRNLSAVSRVWSFVLAVGFPLPGLQSSFEDKTRKTLVGIGSCRLVTPLTQLKAVKEMSRGCASTSVQFVNAA
jgi:hypothetical protein